MKITDKFLKKNGFTYKDEDDAYSLLIEKPKLCVIKIFNISPSIDEDFQLLGYWYLKINTKKSSLFLPILGVEKLQDALDLLGIDLKLKY